MKGQRCKKSKPCKPRPQMKRSHVWKHFNIVTDENGQRSTACSECSWKRKYTSSTSGMAHHIKHDLPHLINVPVQAPAHRGGRTGGAQGHRAPPAPPNFLDDP